MQQDYKATEAIIQFLFAFDCSGTCDEELVSVMMQKLEISKKKTKELFEKASMIWQQHHLLDEEIAARSLDYDFSRIGFIEKSILRYALFLMKDHEVKITVLLKEMMRIAKKFSTPHAAKYINAILDAKVTTASHSSE